MKIGNHKKIIANSALTSGMHTIMPSEPVDPPPLFEGANPVESEALPGTQSPKNFPIVGIGASAGGLAAFEAFFSGMPADSDPDMAFVLVQHLAPDHKSILTDLIRRYTRMRVFEVEDGMTVQPNCAYIIPPNCDMAFLNGTLYLLEPSAPRGHRLPIDFFFRSLAQDQRERAIGIVLSGTGSDGALGVRAIKGEGGMIMVQNPASTEYDGMPRSAIATGLADFELPPAEMPAQLIAYAAYAFVKISRTATASASEVKSMLKKIFILLRSQTGHDFSQYKPTAIHRRIERRMAIHQIETMNGYVKHLQQAPTEVKALFRDLLIGVTRFFRDPETFRTLEERVIPLLFADKPASAAVRVWSVGCSTGEEAYSLAILLQERLEALKQGNTALVFATDIDRQAISIARTGLYPASIAVDISPERLARFFTIEPGGGAYRIRKDIRDMLVFSEQDVIKDPPFSKLDLISCRNLLIYMGGELQMKVIPLFHYSLNPGGFLFLGASETVGAFGDLFAVLDRKLKLYQSKEDLPGAKRAPLRLFYEPATTIDSVFPSAGKAALPVKLPLREEYLRIAGEELEVSSKELNSYTEEMQSMNEELQTANEELETSKEELQSVNEELSTVNAELQTRVADLTRANNDMNNLLAGTGIGTVFVDRQLRILRFTPPVTGIINLIPSDVGRPIGHIVPNLEGHDGLAADAQAVLDTLAPREAEVQTTEGTWYTMRILPYRTLDNIIEGAVITFVDITERRQAEEALEKASDDIRTLRGILPICSNCKKIRDDRGYWNQVEVYIRDHSEAQFSHGICPGCIKILYPKLKKQNGNIPEQRGAQ